MTRSALPPLTEACLLLAASFPGDDGGWGAVSMASRLVNTGVTHPLRLVRVGAMATLFMACLARSAGLYVR